MHTPSLRRLVAVHCLIIGLALSPAQPAFAQLEPDTALDPVVVVATRTPSDIRTLGSAVDLETPEDLLRRQLATLADALGILPGAPSFANGAAGSADSVFMRGANSDQTLFLVDGIRMNDDNTDYAVFLGGARLGASDSVEVARGPQSILYGSGAAGGVVLVEAQKGAGDPSAEACVNAGSFGTFGGGLDTQGTRGPWAWSFTASGSHTDNERANNRFDSADVVVRLDRALTSAASAGATLRGFHGRFGDPGDQYTNDAYAHETEDNWLGTAFVDLRPAPGLSFHAIAGGQDRRFVSFDQLPGVFTSTTVVQDRRGVLDAQGTYSGLEAQRISVGAYAESQTTRDNGFGSIDRRQGLLSGFAEDEWSPVSSVHVTGGLRYDDFDTFGHAFTGRATAAWISGDRSVKLRASYGTGFNAPSFLELYGVATGYRGNPGLRPEKSRGGDVGLDLYLPGNRGTVSLSAFRNDFTDLISYDFNSYPGTTANVGKARTSGVEVESKLSLSKGLELRLAYTYLDARDLTGSVRLLRRPRNSLSADLWRDCGSGFSAGAGVGVVSGRQDVDALTYATVNDPDYAVARVYAQWKATPRLGLKARVENLLDRSYQPVNGYPALGRGIYGEFDWRL